MSYRHWTDDFTPIGWIVDLWEFLATWRKWRRPNHHRKSGIESGPRMTDGI